MPYTRTFFSKKTILFGHVFVKNSIWEQNVEMPQKSNICFILLLKRYTALPLLGTDFECFFSKGNPNTHVVVVDEHAPYWCIHLQKIELRYK